MLHLGLNGESDESKQEEVRPIPPPLPPKAPLPPATKTSGVKVLVFIGAMALGAFAILMTLVVVFSDGKSSSVPDGGSSGIITYRVSGTATTSDITYENDTNGTTHVKSGFNINGQMWFTKTVGMRPGELAYLTAQNNWDSGNVVVEILSHGNVIKRSESNGAYCIATVSLRID